MARIPVYQEREAPSGSFRVSELRVPDMNLDAMGEALQGLGRATGQAAQAAIDVETERAKAEAYKAIEDIGLQQEKQLLLMQETDAANGAERFLEKFQGQYDKTIDDYVGQATQPNSIGRKVMVESFRQLRKSLSSRALAFQAETGRLYRRGQYDRAVELAAQRLALDPRQENLDETLGRLQAFRESLRDTPGQKIRQEETTRVTLAKSGLEAIIRERPGEFLAEIEAGKKRGLKTKTGNAFLDLIPADQWDTYINAAKTQLNQKASANRGEINSRVKNSEAMAVNGIADPNPISREEFVNAYGPEDGEKAYRGYQEMQMMAGEISAMANMSSAEIGEMIMKSAPQPGADYAAASERQKIKLEAFKRILQIREDDSAMYVLQNNATVNEIYQDYDRINVFDPTLMPEQREEAMARKKAAAEKYANAMLAEQTRLGIASQGVLSKNALLQIQQDYLTTPQGEPTAENVKAMAEIWGNSWPAVYSQLISEKILPPMAIVIGSDPNMPGLYSSAMVDASRRPIKDWLIAQPSTTETDLKDYVSNQMQPFMQTMIGASGNARMAGGFETFEVFYNSALQLAAMYVSRGKTPAEAARMASEQVVLERYNFNESYRVPVEYDMNNVENGARQALYNLTTDDLMPTASLLPMDTTLEEQLISLKKYGYWVTDETESGLILYDANTQAAVLNKDGVPIRKSFSDLTKTGETVQMEVYEDTMLAP